MKMSLQDAGSWRCLQETCHHLLPMLTGLVRSGYICTIWINIALARQVKFVECVLSNEEASSGCSESLEFQGGSEFDMDPW